MAVPGTASQDPPRGWLRLLLRLPVALFRLRLGWLLGRRLVLLTHTGRRTGKVHSTVLEVMHYDRATHHCLVVSDWGKRSQWYMNVLANPSIRFTLGHHERAGKARQLEACVAEQRLRDYGDSHRAAIRARTRFIIGEAFEGSTAQYRRMADRVPMLELVPDANDDNAR